MSDFWLDMALSVIFTTLKQIIKSPSKKAEVKKAMLKLRNTIDAVYADDADFQ